MNMKKFSKICLLMLLLALAVFTAVSCDKEPAVSSDDQITVKEAPQLMYLVGEELDFSNGILEVKIAGAVTEVAMNAEGVTVTGYDKTKLGEQTLTVTYNGLTTEIKVTVVERMQATEFVTDYLVGDTFDTSKGRLKITRNDGTTYTVILSSDKVTVSGFDSSAAGTKTVTAKYVNGQESYECHFNVQVHAVENVEFVAPKKVAYDSHETALDVTDGYLLLKGKGGALSKKVTLTTDMVTGFNLAAVNKTNSPLTQELTVTYNGGTYKYNVQLVYTDISYFNEKAAEFAAMDWFGETLPNYTDAQGELAMELMAIYLDLSKAEKSFITGNAYLNVARTALMYGMDSMEDEFTVLEGAFEISGGGVSFTFTSPKDVQDAIDLLKDSDNGIYTATELLIPLIEEFSDTELITEVYFGDYAMIEIEFYEDLIDLFEHALEVHELVSEIPEDWKAQGVNTFASEIEAVYNAIMGSGYTETYAGEVYYRISAWRTDDDAFDILYAYYFGQNNADALQALSNVRLPGDLEDLASYIALAMDEVTMIGNYQQVDTSVFMYYYYLAQQTAEQIKTSDDEMIKALYQMLSVNGALGLDDSYPFSFDTMLEYLRTMEGGFYSFSGGLLGIDEYHALMDRYMALLINILGTEGYENTAQYSADVEAIFDMFLNLSSTQQFNFLSTLNAYYGMGIPPLAFDDSGEFADFTCVFVSILNEYYRGKLSADAQSAYNDLVIAMEIYAQRASYENWLEEFKARMNAVVTAYQTKMNVVDQAAFERYLGAAYEKYTAILARFGEPPVSTDLGEWQDEFDALQEAIEKLDLAYALIENDLLAYSLFFSAFERAQLIVNNILENAPEDIVKAYLHEELYVYEVEGEGTEGEGTEGEGTEGEGTEGTPATETGSATYEYMFNLYRGMYIYYQQILLDGSSAYDLYNAGNLATFMDQSNAIMWTYLLSDEDASTLDFDKAQVLQALATFRNLTVDEQVLFILMEGEQGFYYTALVEFLSQNYTEKAAEMALKVLELEQVHMAYLAVPDATYLQILKTTVADAKAMYEDLSNSAVDKASFADFEEAYTFYIESCEALIVEAEAANGSSAA